MNTAADLVKRSTTTTNPTPVVKLPPRKPNSVKQHYTDNTNYPSNNGAPLRTNAYKRPHPIDSTPDSPISPNTEFKYSNDKFNFETVKLQKNQVSFLF